MKQIRDIYFTKPKIVNKGWGREEILVNKDFCGKLLVFNKGSKFSLHFHKKKNELFYVLLGKIRFNYLNLENADKKSKELIIGDSVFIPAGNPHQIEALEDSTIIEISSHHEDFDSYRIEKGDSQINMV